MAIVLTGNPGSEFMGEIVVDAELENPVDRGYFERRHGEESDIRRTSVKAVLDTGAVMLMLPQNVVERLGINIRRTVVVTCADERREELPVAGPVTVRLCNRFMSIDCVVGPPLSEPLIGQVILESLDLIADCRNQTLAPRPESPGLSAPQDEVICIRVGRSTVTPASTARPWVPVLDRRILSLYQSRVPSLD